MHYIDNEINNVRKQEFSFYKQSDKGRAKILCENYVFLENPEPVTTHRPTALAGAALTTAHNVAKGN